eukprot:1150462-Pelagomonas_calceolata.AAC.1
MAEVAPSCTFQIQDLWNAHDQGYHFMLSTKSAKWGHLAKGTSQKDPCLGPSSPTSAKINDYH